MRGLDERVKKAIEQDPTIMSTRQDIDNAQGRSTEDMEKLGLSKQDLKWLERKGLAIRAYTGNGYMHYFDKDGKAFQQRRFNSGSRVKWILFVPDFLARGSNDDTETGQASMEDVQGIQTGMDNSKSPLSGG